MGCCESAANHDCIESQCAPADILQRWSKTHHNILKEVVTITNVHKLPEQLFDVLLTFIDQSDTLNLQGKTIYPICLQWNPSKIIELDIGFVGTTDDVKCCLESFVKYLTDVQILGNSNTRYAYDSIDSSILIKTWGNKNHSKFSSEILRYRWFDCSWMMSADNDDEKNIDNIDIPVTVTRRHWDHIHDAMTLIHNYILVYTGDEESFDAMKQTYLKMMNKYVYNNNKNNNAYDGNEDLQLVSINCIVVLYYQFSDSKFVLDKGKQFAQENNMPFVITRGTSEKSCELVLQLLAQNRWLLDNCNLD